MLHYKESLLNNKNIEKEVLDRIFSKKRITPENFYRTGFEYIPFSKDRVFAIESLLSSVIPFDKRLIIVNSGEDSIIPVEICLDHDIEYRITEIQDTNSLEDLLSGSSAFSHIFITLSDKTLNSDDFIRIKDIARENDLDIIIDYTGDISYLSGFSLNYFDFIAASIHFPQTSFIAARRNKLVQTEGNARSCSKDLHSFWQQTLRNRTREIEPLFL